MITKQIRGNIFETKDIHIIFALNTEGHNDGGFAGQVAQSFFPEIENTGGNKLGEVLKKTVKGKTFYGIVCHSLLNGWGNSDQIILKALNDMHFSESASIVSIGGGMIGTMSGSPIKKIQSALEECNKNLTVYFL